MAADPAKGMFAKILVVTRPLSVFMDDVSLVEVAQNRAQLRGLGFKLESSGCQYDRREVARMNLQLLTGETGRKAVDAYTDMLQSPHTSDAWFSQLGVSKQDSLASVFLGLCDAWRRLVLPFQCLPFQFLRIIVYDGSQGLDYAETLAKQTAGCSGCSDRMFSEVFSRWLLADEAPEALKLRRLHRLQLVLEDLLVTLPATSVQVERQHANIQVDASAAKRVPKRPSGIQSDSYLTTCVLEHSNVLRRAEAELFGDAKTRIRRALKARTLESSAPAAGLHKKRKLTQDGTVKGRPGLLQGILPGPHFVGWGVPLINNWGGGGRRGEGSSSISVRSIRAGGVRKDNWKTARRMSAFNAFQAASRILG